MQVVDFVVHGHSSDDAVRAARAILAGHGFSVTGTPAGRILATRGNRLLTMAFGALVPADRHYQRLSLETVPHPDGSGRGVAGLGRGVAGLRAHTIGPAAHTSGPGAHTSGPAAHTSGPGAHTSGPGAHTVGPGAHVVSLRLRAHHGGAAVAAGAVQRSRTSAMFREVADRIATTLVAGGQLVARHDRH